MVYKAFLITFSKEYKSICFDTFFAKIQVDEKPENATTLKQICAVPSASPAVYPASISIVMAEIM